MFQVTHLQTSAIYNNWQITFGYLKINVSVWSLEKNLCKLLGLCIF